MNSHKESPNGLNDTVEMNKGVVLRPSINVPKAFARQAHRSSARKQRVARKAARSTGVGLQETLKPEHGRQTAAQVF